MIINLELVTGDVRRIGQLDFLLMGHKNPLRDEICRETGSQFKTVKSESWLFPHHYEVLNAPDYQWRKVAAVKFRANGKISETQFVRISSPITAALKASHIQTMGIVPPTWRNPGYCALGVIYALWVIGYAAVSAARSPYPDLMGEPFPDPSHVTFKVIAQTGIEHLEAVLKDDCHLMWGFIQQLCQQKKDELFAPDYKTLRKIPVKFNVKNLVV